MRCAIFVLVHIEGLSMENRLIWARYVDLAEFIFFKGLTSEQLSEQGFVLKEGKNFRDINEACQLGRLEGIGKFEREIGCIARKLQEVLETI